MMFKHFLLATAIGAILAPVAYSASEYDCVGLSIRPDVYADKVLSPAFLQALKNSGRVAAADGVVDQMSFIEACEAGVFKFAARVPDSGAPLAGANSFTQVQALDRIDKSGFTAISSLKIDEQGIWRANALQGGKAMSVALDFKGNVVAK